MENSMRCSICGKDAVICQAYSGRSLCGRHLAADIEARAKRSIRTHRWLRSGDHIAVPLSGDRKSAALLCFLRGLTAARRDIRLSAIPAGEDRAGKESRSAAREVAGSLRIPCIELPEQERNGTAAMAMVPKIALALSLDDIAQGTLREFLFGSAGRLVHPLPDRSCRRSVICPFMAVPSDEIERYWDLQGTGISLPPAAPVREAGMRETAALLEDYTRRHPAADYALLHLAERLSGDNAAAAVTCPVCPDRVPAREPCPRRGKDRTVE